eukprot:CAMPEP_0177558428 /NCGR_PEP_ID=MMETSP0369-20130122/70258_1 /TAXON_ID=447022 ORGANISM="Scrippsiella hangoei-like, Strain SHHI-4" /NCGR_SAMPLE_ID=MMETSP0369 /ASSEMBLY_ACC=CAM_ASM_000364 /LENGTH=44 /DNA_ID= /DNA_START= /DNA_END= /DNA_ORIENTATION=
MALHRVREDFIKKQRKMKHLDWLSSASSSACEAPGWGAAPLGGP